MDTLAIRFLKAIVVQSSKLLFFVRCGETPNFDYCDCCHVELGNQDSLEEGIRKFRSEWLSKGAKWFDERKKPENWSLEEQLKNIAAEYR